MSSVLPLREFISGRLTAAAEEILGVFEGTIVQYQTEIDHLRRLLESSWKHEPSLHRTELLRQYLNQKEEIPADQQLFTKRECSSLNQEPPEPPQFKEEHEEPETSQIKEEHEELCRIQEDEQLALNRDSGAFVMPLTYEQRVQNEPEPNRDRILSHVFSEVESRDHEGRWQEGFESTRKELKPKERHYRSHSNNVDKSFMSESPFETETSNTLVKCDACEDAFHTYVEMKKHFRIHSDLSQHYVSNKEETPADKQLSNQQGSSNLDQKEPEPPPIKEEQREPKPLQIKEEEQLVLKEEIDTFTVTSAYEESDDSEPEPTTNQRLLQNYLEAGSRDQQGSWHEDFGSTSTAEPMPKMTHCKNMSHGYTVVNQSQSNTGERSLECQFCRKVFENNVDMKEHYKLHTGEKSLSCSVCGKVFKYNVNLLVHMRTHTGEKPYPCEICGKCFSQKVNLNVHMRTHTGEKPYLCKTCGKRFSDSSGFKRHTTIHTGEKPYVCKTCNKTFRYNVNLLVHMRTHTDERPYFCKTCGRTFSDPSTLRKHIITHTGAKSYSCQICGKCFTDNSNLLRHMRTHTGEKPYSCEICGKSFSQSSNLMQHIRTHTGEKPYPCGICDKSYSHSCTLLKHMRSHTGEKPYSCETCGRCFSHKCTLLKHMKIHTDKIQS
ncbi:zinc finger protein 2 homolog [Kryptolebias marmoratus]|nr:zinc finger protein 2 homolog [Kryptolebias marmoratus]